MNTVDHTLLAAGPDAVEDFQPLLAEATRTRMPATTTGPAEPSSPSAARAVRSPIAASQRLCSSVDSYLYRAAAIVALRSLSGPPGTSTDGMSRLAGPGSGPPAQPGRSS